MQQKAFALFLLSTLCIGFLALESLHYKTIYGVIKFHNKPEPNQLSGKFSHPEKSYELLFNCRLNGENRDISLTDVYKNIIIKYLHTASEVTYIQLGQYHFIAHNKTGKILNLPNPDLIPKEHEHEKHLDLYSQIEKLGKSNISFQHVIREAAEKHILVEELSKSLGNVFGRSGSEYPCVMGLHIISRALITSNSIPLDEVDEEAGDGKGGKHLVKRGTCNNPDIRYCAKKPRGTRCVGMCGKTDSCWDLVCGDCCYHKGCAEHDHCCHVNGYISFKCLFPWGFKCKGYNPGC